MLSTVVDRITLLVDFDGQNEMTNILRRIKKIPLVRKKELILNHFELQ